MFKILFMLAPGCPTVPSPLCITLTMSKISMLGFMALKWVCVIEPRFNLWFFGCSDAVSYGDGDISTTKTRSLVVILAAIISEENKLGEGGFGPVYKVRVLQRLDLYANHNDPTIVKIMKFLFFQGYMHENQIVAIKRLSNKSLQVVLFITLEAYRRFIILNKLVCDVNVKCPTHTSRSFLLIMFIRITPKYYLSIYLSNKENKWLEIISMLVATNGARESNIVKCWLSLSFFFFFFEFES